MTYDPGTDSVTTENNLTQDEQESLVVGEQLEEAQESMLAGKYKDAQELEKAYIALEKKMGEKSGQDSQEESSDEPQAEENLTRNLLIVMVTLLFLMTSMIKLLLIRET